MTLRQKYHKNRKVTIYEIVCLTTSQRYIGSTIDYKSRKNNHKIIKNETESKNIIKNNNYKINILEEFYCNYELSRLLKEQYYLDNLENINKNRALSLLNAKRKYNREYLKIWRKNRTKEQNEKIKEYGRNYVKIYYQKNKERIKEISNKYHKDNYQKNKISILQRNKKWSSVKYTCECGKSIRRDSKGKHNKTKYHLDYLRKNTI